jgi:hypothetical protein
VHEAVSVQALNGLEHAGRHVLDALPLAVHAARRADEREIYRVTGGKLPTLPKQRPGPEPRTEAKP